MDKPLRTQIQDLTAQLGVFQTEIASQNTVIVGLREQLQAANAAAEQADVEADEARDTLATMAEDLKVVRLECAAAIAAEQDKLDQLAAKKAAAIVAAQGLTQPLAAKPDAPITQPINQLTGLDRVVAVFKAQSAKRKE